MTTHVIRPELLTDKYGDGVLSAQVRLLVKGSRWTPGFQLGYCPPTATCRRTTGGPVLPGPYAYSYGVPAVIDNHGGTRAEIDQAKANGTLIEAEAGDYIEIQGVTFVLGVGVGFLPHSHQEHLTLEMVPTNQPDTRLCPTMHPTANHTDGALIMCTESRGHGGEHQDASHADTTGEVICWGGKGSVL